MFVLLKSEIDVLRESIRAAFPREACGVLLKEDIGDQTILSLRWTRHDENTPISFVIRDQTLDEIKRSLAGTAKMMCGCVHSHIFGRAWPSRWDRAGDKTPGELWLIYSLRAQSLRLFEWDGAGFQRRPIRIMARQPPRSSAPLRTNAGCGCGSYLGSCKGCADIAKRIESSASMPDQIARNIRLD